MEYETIQEQERKIKEKLYRLIPFSTQKEIQLSGTYLKYDSGRDSFECWTEDKR